MRSNIYWIRISWPGRLAILARPRGNGWLEDEIDGLVGAGVSAVVSLLTVEESNELGLVQERDVAEAKGLTFINFPIDDYGVPSSKKGVSELITTLGDLLSRGKSVGIHCRQGIGRSSLIAACLLCQSNSDIDACFAQISEARGSNVPDTAEQKNWVKAFAVTHSPQLIPQ